MDLFLLLLLTLWVAFLMGQIRITKEQRVLLINPNLFYSLPKFLKNKVQGLFKTELPTLCTICITDCEPQEMHRIRLCGCWFCKTVSFLREIKIVNILVMQKRCIFTTFSNEIVKSKLSKQIFRLNNTESPDFD